jgi:serine/threonine-protein kinase
VDPTLDHHLQQEAEARVGQTLRGKWRLDGVLGVGGMAAVYSATHRNGIRCAVKMLHAAFSEDTSARDRFLREGKIANQVDHPGVVQVLDDDVTEDGQAFLVMELLEGKALHELASESAGRLDPARALLLADQLLDALAAAHDQGVLHRDVKPENVFLTTEGRVKILDFGIAHVVDVTGAVRATQAGTPMGTPAFMSPEQARGRWDLVGPQSDVWGVGASLFTLLSGRMIHDGETVQELMAAVFSKPAPSLATVAPEMPKEVVDVVDRALALRMTDRWEDARAMRDAVRAAYRALTGHAVPAPPPATARLSMVSAGTRARLPSGADRASETMASLETVVPVGVPRHRGARLVAAAALGLLVVLSFLSLVPSQTARSATAMQPADAPSSAAHALRPSAARASAVAIAVDATPPADAPPALAEPRPALAEPLRAGATPAFVSAAPSQSTRVVASDSVAAAPSKTRPNERARRAVDLKALYDRRL